MVSLTPVRDLVLLRALPEAELETRVNGLHLPQTAIARQRFRQWEIVACGPDVAGVALLPGLRVIVRKLAGQPFEHEGTPHLMVAEDDVQAWVDE